MTCYSPIRAYRDSSGRLFFHAKPGTNAFKVPCGQCVGCRLERSRQWAARCMHEASLHAENCFVTLTYRPECCPVSLAYEDFQLFLKRLRKAIEPRRVRFYMCGEYGETGGRPHYHALLFGWRPSDLVLFKKGLYRSRLLEVLWPHGFVAVGNVTFESAAYTARYVMKKITGQAADTHYRHVDEDTGEVVQRVPEFCHMSLKPGIGAGWLGKYLSDVYPNGTMVVRGHETSPARYYDKIYRRIDRDGYEAMKARRNLKAWDRFHDNVCYRLVVRGKVEAARLKLLKRKEF